ncbi:hypothetical protein Pelo_16207 [Pelomyxa schiedti]|nr:hypothetical protein Pelo_16207 [Pelomyxa schiedti]
MIYDLRQEGESQWVILPNQVSIYQQCSKGFKGPTIPVVSTILEQPDSFFANVEIFLRQIHQTEVPLGRNICSGCGNLAITYIPKVFAHPRLSPWIPAFS